MSIGKARSKRDQSALFEVGVNVHWKTLRHWTECGLSSICSLFFFSIVSQRWKTWSQCSSSNTDGSDHKLSQKSGCNYRPTLKANNKISRYELKNDCYHGFICCSIIFYSIIYHMLSYSHQTTFIFKHHMFGINLRSAQIFNCLNPIKTLPCAFSRISLNQICSNSFMAGIAL